MLDRPARLDVRDVPLEKALVLLQRASGVALAYSPDLVPDERRVSCACRGVTVAQALDRLLEGTGLRYRLGDDNVVIGRWKGAAWPECAGHLDTSLHPIESRYGYL
jgi:hypothetical protein